MRADRLLGLVWFGFRQHGGPFRQDWRVESSRVAQAAFKLVPHQATFASMAPLRSQA